MPRPLPNGGQPYAQQFRGGYTIPSVRVRHVVRAAEAREARIQNAEEILAAIVDAVVVALVAPWNLLVRRRIA